MVAPSLTRHVPFQNSVRTLSEENVGHSGASPKGVHAEDFAVSAVSSTSLAARLVPCRPDDSYALSQVVEPSTCVYQAVFRSPSACVAEGLRAKLEEISRASLEVGVQYEIDEDTRALLAL